MEVATADGNVCSAEMCVLLFDPPQVAATTVPNYHYLGSRKVIDICLGETITFTDQSVASGTSLIAGHSWECSEYGNASTPNYEIKPVQSGSFTVTHSVINSCGCESKEYYDVVVRDVEVEFELSCYGTVCAGSTHTYTLRRPNCEKYIWTVDRGNIIAGDGTPEITVQWDNSPLGYGVITLDLSYCDVICSNTHSVRIPIISNNVEIVGGDTVCVGDSVVYEVALWGSTEYKWSINPSQGVLKKTYKNANSQLVSFNTVGTYEISVEYYNDFLDCGKFYSLTKNVVVKEKLEISPFSSKICQDETKTSKNTKV